MADKILFIAEFSGLTLIIEKNRRKSLAEGHYSHCKVMTEHLNEIVMGDQRIFKVHLRYIPECTE